MISTINSSNSSQFNNKTIKLTFILYMGNNKYSLKNLKWKRILILSILMIPNNILIVMLAKQINQREIKDLNQQLMQQPIHFLLNNRIN